MLKMMGKKISWADPEGGQGVQTHPGKSQVAMLLCFLRNAGTDPLLEVGP